MAGRQGFEPRFNGSEPFVLPLDDLPTGTGIVVEPLLAGQVSPGGLRSQAAKALSRLLLFFAEGDHDVEERRADREGGEGEAGRVDQLAGFDAFFLGEPAQGGFGGFDGEASSAW